MIRGKGLTRALVRRGTRSDHKPPVTRRGLSPAEHAVCERCGSVYAGATWRSDRKVPDPPIGVPWTVCPACAQVRRHEYFGRVLAHGPFAIAHEDELRRRIRNVIQRARFTQPQRRLVHMIRDDDGLEVLVTSQKLAHRIVAELSKAFKGHGRYHWADRDGELTAVWSHERVASSAGRRSRRGGRRGGRS
jgi:hypothetical protein